MNRFHHTSNGETFIEELGMDVGFIIETDNKSIADISKEIQSKLVEFAKK